MHVLRRTDDDTESMDVIVRRFWTAGDRGLVRCARPSSECSIVELAQWVRSRPTTPRRT
jgi:hypothetical protein